LEVLFQKLFPANGWKYKKNVTSMEGKPDIVFPNLKLAIFIDSVSGMGADTIHIYPKAIRNIG